MKRKRGLHERNCMAPSATYLSYSLVKWVLVDSLYNREKRGLALSGSSLRKII